MAVPRQEKAYEKHAWIIPFAIGAFNFIFGLALTVGGPSIDPELELIAGVTFDQLSSSSPRVAALIDFSYKNLGFAGLIGNFLIMVISLKSYRRGEEWSWFALWVLPVFAGASILLLLSYGSSSFFILLTATVFVVSVLGLLLPYRKFFPKKQAPMAHT